MNSISIRRSGFTIVELLIVIVVIAILAAITIVAYNGISNRAKASSIISDTQSSAKKIATWTIQNANTLPADESALATSAGLSDGNGKDYTYSRMGSNYCLTITSQGLTRHVAGTNDGQINSIVEGPCAGHGGTIPTTLADGSSCPTNFIVVPGNSLFNTATFCAMKYEAKNVSSVATSQAASAPWSVSSLSAAQTAASGACSGCHLMTNEEWLTIAHNVSTVNGNWTGGTVGSGSLYIGHSDGTPSTEQVANTSDASGYHLTGQTTGNQRRTLTLTNGQVIWDLAGNIQEITGSTGASILPGRSDTCHGWLEWNDSGMTGGNFALWIPANGSSVSNISSLTSANGLGQMITCPSLTDDRAVIRGGAAGSPFSTSRTGVFSVYTYDSATATYTGFRAAK